MIKTKLITNINNAQAQSTQDIRQYLSQIWFVKTAAHFTITAQDVKLKWIWINKLRYIYGICVLLTWQIQIDKTVWFLLSATNLMVGCFQHSPFYRVAGTPWDPKLVRVRNSFFPPTSIASTWRLDPTNLASIFQFK